MNRQVINVRRRLSRINTCLLVLIIIINGYIIAMPFMPAIVFGYRSHHGQAKQTLIDKLHADSPTPSPSDPKPAAETGDRLVIPSILLDVPYFEGRDARTLRKGPWLRPTGSTPERGGNVVIAGHRFTYTNPRGEFYHLDKVKVGDEIGLFRQSARRIYIVREIKVTSAVDTTVEAYSPTPRLTLYTCTPLWLPKDRLVVVAAPADDTPDASSGAAP